MARHRMSQVMGTIKALNRSSYDTDREIHTMQPIELMNVAAHAHDWRTRAEAKRYLGQIGRASCRERV